MQGDKNCINMCLLFFRTVSMAKIIMSIQHLMKYLITAAASSM